MIEKNIRLQPHHARDLLVGRRSDGKRPKYQPPSQGGGFANTGGGGGEWSPSVSYSPPPVSRPSPHVDSAANLMAQATRMENERKAKEAAIAKIIEQEVVIPHLGGADDSGWTRAFESPTNITGDTPEERREKEFLETGDYETLIAPDLGKRIDTAPKVDLKDIMGEVDDPGSVSYDPTYKTPEEIRTLSQDPDYGQFFRQPTVVEKPKTGIGGILKNVAMAVIPGLLPAKAATAYRLAKAGYDIKKGKGILGQAFKKVEPRLAKFKVPGTGTKKLVKHEPVDRDGIQQAITGEEGLLTEGAKTLGLTEDQREQYKLMQNKMKTALDQGSYTNEQGQVIQLNEQQMDQLQNYIDRLDSILQTTLQTAAHGGRIDGPLMGGSRYI